MTGTPDVPATIPAIEDRIEAWLDDHDPPGVGVAIVDGDETVYAAGFGHRRLDPGRPATAETLWGIGSATKPLTATAVACLLDCGALALEDPVAEYVPYFEQAPGEPITVGELLSHTSGLPSTGVAGVVLLDDVLDVDVGVRIDGWEDFREYVNGAADRRRTDERRVLYCNAGYSVLGRLVAAVTDQSFAAFVDRAVFEPLEMERATFDVGVLDETDEDVMTPYLAAEDGLRTASLPAGPGFEAPGGLLASVTDLGRFLRAAIDGGPHLDDALRERLYDPVGPFREFVGGVEQLYAYGWMRRPFGSDTLIGHGGGTGVSGGYVGFLRDRGLGVAVGVNGAAPTEELAIELLATLLDRDLATVLPERAIERSVDGLEGRYESYSGIQSATVEWTGDRLEVAHENPLDADTYRLAPTSFDPSEPVFATVDGDGHRVVAEFLAAEDATELLMGRQLFRRVADLPNDDAEEPTGETASGAGRGAE